MENTPGSKAQLVSELYMAAQEVDLITKVYGKCAKVYDSLCLTTWKGPTAIADAAQKVVSDQATDVVVLDFGAGTGLCGIAMKSAGFKTIDAMDVSKEMLDEAERVSGGTLYRTVYIGLIGTDFSIEACNYDMIVSSGVIGTHVYTDIVSLLMPLVKPGGSLIYTIRLDTDDGNEFSSFYASLSGKKGEGCGTWERVSSSDVGPLNIDIPNVTHRVVVLKRIE